MFGRDSKAGKRLGTLYNGKKKKKKEGFLYGGFWHGEVREANKRQASL